jgi:gas vesicle protein
MLQSNIHTQTHKKEANMANTTRNGYEIRADLLGLAKQIAEFNYQIKFNEYEMSSKKDGDQVVTEFKFPTISAEDIIDNAKKFNDFVTTGANTAEGTQLLMENVKKFNEKIQESFKPEQIQNNIKAYQDNVKKFTETFFNGAK